MKDIVVGMDLSEDAGTALRWAVDEARLHGAGVRAVFAWSADRCPKEVREHAASSRAEHIEAAAEELLHAGIERVLDATERKIVTESVVTADPVDALLDAVPAAGMLVVGARGAGRLRRAVIGSVSDACLHLAPGTVVVVRRARSKPAGESGVTGRDARPVLVGVDGSENSIKALRWAAQEAALRGVTLRVRHAWMPMPMIYAGYITAVEGSAMEEAAQAVLDETLKTLPDLEDLTLDAGIMICSPGTGLIHDAADAQLLVVGARGHEGFAELLLGSTGHRCAHHAPCPVAVIHGDTTA
ncbi:universal stress protein [Frankia sp. Cr1]|uniref:universal stress protein n=1 Tax=Frankia sp. Cr1 TaxID=3073931 RepID=UPI002AD2FD69|nr:universal stress protein [Frankia sp. Cr1]